jgi:hypothetical protein
MSRRCEHFALNTDAQFDSGKKKAQPDAMHVLCVSSTRIDEEEVTRLNVARQNVADKMLRTKCRGQMVAKKTSHGQMVARTKCCKDKTSQDITLQL